MLDGGVMFPGMGMGVLGILKYPGPNGVQAQGGTAGTCGLFHAGSTKRVPMGASNGVGDDLLT